MKKIISLVLALCMVLTIGIAFADTATTATLAPDAGIEIIGLETGDTVKLYQVLKWTTNVGWTKTTDFNSLADASVKTLVGDKDTAGTLTNAIATEIYGIFQNNDTMAAKYGPLTAGSMTDGFGVQKTGAEPGLYMAIINSGSSIVSYNPVFVSCDYYADNGETLGIVVNKIIANVGYAKKTTDIDIDKKVKDGDTGVVDEWATAEKGETVQFIVNTTIPSYHSSEWDVNKISYVVKDTLTGLALVNNESHLPTVEVKPIQSEASAFAPLATSKYTLTATSGTSALTLNIEPSYLKEIEGPYSLRLTYYAQVTDEAVTSVSATDNKVEVEYSNNPEDATSKGKKHDATNHYKFALDADLFGNEEYHTSELVKVGLNADGTVIYEKTGYSNYSKHSALQGAKFGLYSSKTAAEAAIDGDGTGLESDENGRFLISNLDVGTYFLVETKAPDGYIRDNAIYQIDITATEKNVKVNDGDCQYTMDVLDTYSVKVSAIENGTTTEIATSTYTMVYEGTPTDGVYDLTSIKLKTSTKVTEETKENHPEDNTTEIRNRKGTQLPSTGGIGTTIFYILGGLLVVGAAVILVARRKAQD